MIEVRTDVAAAINTHVVPVVLYAPDPRGGAMFAGLVHSIADTMRPGTVYPGPHAFHGNAVSPQRYAGAAALAAAVHSGTVIAPRNSTFDQEREANPSIAAAMAVFRENLQG